MAVPFKARIVGEASQCPNRASGEPSCRASSEFLYLRDDNERLRLISESVANYTPCQFQNCSCYSSVIENDLKPFQNGITLDMINAASQKGTKYWIINSRLYREVDCMFPARCSGVEHFLSKLKNKLPDLQLVLNTRDWPQISRFHGAALPVFSFSKTKDYLDIMYPSWGFWEGGPAIKLYPQGLGRWDKHRRSISEEANKWPWEKKKPVAFFRGSRTSSERDSLVLLSRESPNLVDAAYTKNQAWKSEKDTLFLPPAAEVSLEEHCHYKYLFNFRGVAASFRLKHLFLCQSVVFHVGNEWEEFFYSSLKQWVHYIPVKSDSTKEDLRNLIEFAQNQDKLVKEIAVRGQDFIWSHLRMKDILCYWKALLKQYAKLLKFKPKLGKNIVEITDDVS